MKEKNKALLKLGVAQLYSSFISLWETVEHIEADEDINMNDVDGFCAQYPFSYSLDEMPLEVLKWLDGILETKRLSGFVNLNEPGTKKLVCAVFGEIIKRGCPGLGSITAKEAVGLHSRLEHEDYCMGQEKEFLELTEADFVSEYADCSDLEPVYDEGDDYPSDYYEGWWD